MENINDTAQQRGNITETNNIIDLGMKHFIHKMKKIRYNTLYLDACMSYNVNLRGQTL
jgi:hypothetical protein